MKRYQIINFHHLLSRIDLQKVERDARARLIALDITLGDIVDAHDDEVQKIKARLTKGHEEEIREVSLLYAELESADDRKAVLDKIAQHAVYNEIQRQFEDEVNRRLAEDVVAEIDRISSNDLAQWCADSGIGITLDQLRELRKNGLTA